jgi:hypothetical protein
MTPRRDKRHGRLRQPRLLRRDWVGDAVLVVVSAVVLLVSVRLPWANEDGHGWVNYSLSQGGELSGVLDTQWGTPATVLALVVLAAGLVMLVTRPRRFSVLLGLLVAACGVAVFGVAQDAASQIGWYDPGIGMYLTTLVAVLLVPIGLAAALVGWLLLRAERAAAEPPTPGGPPSVAPVAPGVAPAVTTAVTAAGAPPAPPALENGPPS